MAVLDDVARGLSSAPFTTLAVGASVLIAAPIVAPAFG